MDYGYYPGCTLHGTAKEFDSSIKASFKKLGLGMKEVPDWNCCGASSAHSTNEELSLALPVRVLSQAEKAKMETVFVPCAACYSRLKLANNEVQHDAEVLKRVNEIIGAEYQGTVAVKHLIEVYKDNIDKLQSGIVKTLDGLKLACYYGCLLARPRDVVDFDDTENPMVMDEIVTTMGAEALDWSHKTECCGAGFLFSRSDIATRLVGDILDAAIQVEADAIVVACPLCHANLDMRQSVVSQARKKEYNIPVIYISQLVSIALGSHPKELGFNKHIVSPTKVLNKIQKRAQQAVPVE